MSVLPSGINDDEKNAWRAAELISKHLGNKLSAAEKKELQDWVETSEQNRELFTELTNEKNVENAMKWFRNQEQEKERFLRAVKEKIEFTPPRKSLRLNIWWAAASIISISVIGALIYYNSLQKQKGNESIIIRSADIPPGTDKATLQLSDGTIVNLETRRIGKLNNRDSIVIGKIGEGQLSYFDTADGISADLFNTLTTPIGGQYAVDLPDGSKAWLNASSSLKYPISFKKQRVVEAIGEVYFEIKKSKVPFIVKVKEATVEVLGTHFNVNAYTNVKTTLLEGSVRLSKDGNYKILKPGEMGLLSENIEIKKLEYPGDVIAWKNGYFRFNKANIKDIMQQLARWYKMDVSYEGNVDSATFTVAARRNENLSTILRNIEKTGHIHFKIEGSTVKVIP